MRDKHVNLIITGVGGQGILVLSRVIGEAAIKEGYQVKIAEVHGMAQRGGSLVTHVRIGKHVKSPLIPKFKADMLISMEAMESIRCLDYIKPKGYLIINKYILVPADTSISIKFEDLLTYLKSLEYRLIVLDAYRISSQLGETRTTNMVVLGFLIGSNLLPISKNSALKTIEATLPPRFKEVNFKAFNEGYKLGLGYRIEKNLSLY